MEKIRDWDKKQALVRQSWKLNYCLGFITTSTEIEWKDAFAKKTSNSQQVGLQKLGYAFKRVNALVFSSFRRIRIMLPVDRLNALKEWL